MQQPIQFSLNGRPARLSVDGERMLLWVLRTELGLTGTKFGCGQNLCGACTVLVDNEPVRSCRLPVKEVQGRQVVTIEGLSNGEKLHPLQQAFLDQLGYQCGFCTSGMILTAWALLRKKPNPTRAEIVDAMEDNLCRCGSHAGILKSIQAAAVQMNGGKA